MDAIEIDGIKKSYGAVEAVKDVTFSVQKGALFGLIGPDGAGKTTLMRLLSTLVPPDGGGARVLGFDCACDQTKIRATVGYMPQRFSLYQDLSVAQNLHFFSNLFAVPKTEQASRTERLYRFSQLAPFKDRKAGALSGGMKQKLALMCALIHTPKVLLLDEPTFGVDPVSRQEFWEILRTIRKEGTSILVSTAYMDEADLCDRVALMHHGEIRAIDTPNTLRASYRYPLYRVLGKNVYTLRDFLNQQPEVYTTQLFGDAVHVSFIQHPDATLWKRWKQQTHENMNTWMKQSPSIEDVFMDAIGAGR